jgi:prolyl 4-hydroxylase
VLSYEPGQQYKQHADYFNPEYPAFAEMLSILGQRAATCLTWLNEDFAGGETDFPRAGFRHKGRTGDAMLFMNVTQDQKPDPMSVHAGLPVSQGRKWLLSQWVRDREQPII